jgi:hypothetical protein
VAEDAVGMNSLQLRKLLLDHLRFIEDHQVAIFKLKSSFQFFGRVTTQISSVTTQLKASLETKEYFLKQLKPATQLHKV